MKIIYAILMYYYNFLFDASRNDEKSDYYFSKFVFYATKIYKRNDGK